MGEGGGCVVTLAEGRIIGARVESCQCALRLSFFFGKGPATKSNEFSEKFQTAFHPPALIFGIFYKMCFVLIFLNTIVENTYPEL